jgi:hypothetical protein
METYIPKSFTTPEILIDVPSAWKGLEGYIQPLMDELGIPYGENAVFTEFGVEYGYSCIAFANFFGLVEAVDHFEGDIHAGERSTKQQFLDNIPAEFKGKIKVYPISYQDYFEYAPLKQPLAKPIDLVHIDIIHTYEDTFACGQLAWIHLRPKAMLFHDTISLPEVAKACEDLAAKYGLRFLNIPFSYGLGILIK